MPVLNVRALRAARSPSGLAASLFGEDALIWINDRHFLSCGETHNPCVFERMARTLSWLLGLKRDLKSRAFLSHWKEQPMPHAAIVSFGVFSASSLP